MLGEYPVVIDGNEAGKLRVYKQGNKTVFDAFCRDISGIIRLSVYGCGREGYLGVMQPGNGGMHLRKILSPAELRRFPIKIEYAGVQGQKPTPPGEVDTLWKADSLGMLHAAENGNILCAIPQKLGIAISWEELPQRKINGITYRVFKSGNNNRT